MPDHVTAGAWMHLLSSVVAVWLMPLSSLICIDITASYTDQDFPAFACTGRVTAVSWNHSPGRIETCITGCRDFLLEPHMFGCPSVLYQIYSQGRVSCISYLSSFYFSLLHWAWFREKRVILQSLFLPIVSSMALFYPKFCILASLHISLATCNERKKKKRCFTELKEKIILP